MRIPWFALLAVVVALPAVGGCNSGGDQAVGRSPEAAAATHPDEPQGEGSTERTATPVEEEVIELDDSSSGADGGLEFAPRLPPSDPRLDLPPYVGDDDDWGDSVEVAATESMPEVVGKTPAEQAAIDAVRKKGGHLLAWNVGKPNAYISARMHTECTDEDLAPLEQIGGLEVLRMNSCRRITDAGLAHLRRMPAIRDVSLSFTEVGDAGMVHLGAIPRLERLNLTKSKVTDEGLAHLEGLARLKSLSLSGTAVTDAGLEHLAGLTALEELSIGYLKITDYGLRHLEGLKNLKSLQLQRTRVTREGIGVVKKGLPRLEVRSDWNE